MLNTIMMPGRARVARAAGFTLIEVLIALLIAGVGLLGLAKMQALGISSTKESGSRGLISLQASALAATMYSNSAYWATGATTRSITMSGAVVTDASATLSGTGTAADPCTTTCTAPQMAAAEIKSWAFRMAQQFPTYTGKVTCTAKTDTVPVNCTIFISWKENQVVSATSNTTDAAQAAATAGTPLAAVAANFSIHIQP